MKLIFIILTLTLSSCTPIPEKEEYQTKYPDTSTMESAEDAMTGKLFED